MIDSDFAIGLGLIFTCVAFAVYTLIIIIETTEDIDRIGKDREDR